MSVLMLSGSASPVSRSRLLLASLADRLRRHGRDVEIVSVLDLPATDLIEGRTHGAAARWLAARVAPASAIVVATPIYQASISGAFKALLDLLPESAFAGKIVFPLATGGSSAHLLAIEYGLKPVLSALGARHVLAGVFATEAQLRRNGDRLEIAAELEERLENAICELHHALPVLQSDFASAASSQVQDTALALTAELTRCQALTQSPREWQ